MCREYVIVCTLTVRRKMYEKTSTSNKKCCHCDFMLEYYAVSTLIPPLILVYGLCNILPHSGLRRVQSIVNNYTTRIPCRIPVGPTCAEKVKAFVMSSVKNTSDNCEIWRESCQV